MQPLTEEQIRKLKKGIEKWKPVAQAVGPLHAYWDVILDAEALINGAPTLLNGNQEVVFRKLIEMFEE